MQQSFRDAADLTAPRHDDFARLFRAARVARAALRDAARQTTQPDDTMSGRAGAAYQEEAAKWEGLIDAAASDLGLSREQRGSAVAALRVRQQIAAEGARRRVTEEERQNARAARRVAYRSRSRPPRSLSR